MLSPSGSITAWNSPLAVVDTEGTGLEGSPTEVIVQALPGTSFEPGAPIRITVAPGKCYVFDAETGRSDLARERVVTV